MRKSTFLRHYLYESPPITAYVTVFLILYLLIDMMIIKPTRITSCRLRNIYGFHRWRRNLFVNITSQGREQVFVEIDVFIFS